MIKKLCEMNFVLANILVGLIHENDLPVTMKVGKTYVDSNSTRMVSVDYSYPKEDEGIVEKVLEWAQEMAVDRICSSNYKMNVI